ncbi:hypothetical protein DFH28DRAFT_1085196 [Melampsora americana]|nr:hypothetical protein DFH28DRAFT_1085196 [Melampsora americana]
MNRKKSQKINETLGLTKHPQNPPPFPSPKQDDNDNNKWENVNDKPSIGLNSEFIPDSPGNHYTSQARTQHKRKILEAHLTASYIYLQNYTRNWTSQPSFSSYLSETIQCHTSKHPVTFCECVPDAVRLLYLGYISGLPQHPCTAFSVRLVQFHHHLWNNTAMDFLDEKCSSRLKPQQAKGTCKKNINRSLRRPLTQAINIYWQMLFGKQTLYEEGLELTPLNIYTALCARCFGPAEGEVKVSPDEPNFIIAMDGNFQHCHQFHASKDSPKEDQYPNLEQEVVSCQKTDAQAHNLKVGILTFLPSPFARPH